jgi:hypothetical protein
MAAKLAAEIPGIEPEAMAEFLAYAGGRYGRALGLHLEGTPRQVAKDVFAVGKAAKDLLESIRMLGPTGRHIALKYDGNSFYSWLGTEYGEWLFRLATWDPRLRDELEDTPFEGKPVGTTQLLKEIRIGLLTDCWEFLEPHLASHPRVVLKLVPEMSRAIHRIVYQPKLPLNSQLFRKEWEGMEPFSNRAVLLGS